MIYFTIIGLLKVPQPHLEQVGLVQDIQSTGKRKKEEKTSFCQFVIQKTKMFKGHASAVK